jgi:hypothetical protein
VVFAPLEKSALEHWLVVPRTHIRNATTLQPTDLPILKYMRDVGYQVLKEKQPDVNLSKMQFCFHIEPFNSSTFCD